ncbi:hypothetical protein GCM10022199_25450 [Marihabitans asiaticum]|uniref:Uncharacterized protein (TIGR03089 family) n=1 Tax=Marihabitans asiaticum TaxID=415218 RepID=A0A560WCU1_9MICO|nr:TIGR03089 family protein [Marihabitans asiaticum]TWD15438.1 uncharacterized protein (TIGR03089 family) [Marihabitans asiaticum]
MTTTTPAELLPSLLSADPGRPRITCYDDLPGPTAGERVELSAAVLDKWVAKVGNALQEEWDIGPGSRVALRAAPHWRSVYWALGVWRIGATLLVDGSADADDVDLIVTDDQPPADAGAAVVYLTRASLARTADIALAPGVVDEAAELSGYGDHLDPWETPDDDHEALVSPRLAARYLDLVTVSSQQWPGLHRGARLDLAPASTHDLLTAVVATWSVSGSVVVHLGETDPQVRSGRARSEGVDARL